MCAEQPVLHFDFETRSPVDLTKCGVYRYVEHPHTDIWCFAYRFGREPIQLWRSGWEPPARVADHIAAGGRLCAHNANFERQVWNAVLRRTSGFERWPRLTIEQMGCTQARALAIHLPADLDMLARVLGVTEQKDKEGHTLMKKMAKPRRAKKGDNAAFERWGTPENIERLGLYCQQDVATECAIDERLPPLSAAERELWELDQKINDRGVALDLPSVERCLAVLETATERANARMAALTEGAVAKITEAQRIVSWLKGRGIPADSIAKDEHKDLLSWCDVLGDETAADVIRLRAEAGKSSTGKFDAMLRVVCDDGRARGQFRYHNAHTGRWAGGGIQVHNLPRVDDDAELPDVLGALEMLEGYDG